MPPVVWMGLPQMSQQRYFNLINLTTIAKLGFITTHNDSSAILEWGCDLKGHATVL